MAVMPRLSVPPDMPEEVKVVIDALGNAARTEILRLLATNSLTAAQLAAQLNINHASVHRHLSALELAGLVRADQPSGARVGVTVQWSTDIDAVSAALGRWFTYVAGSSS